MRLGVHVPMAYLTSVEVVSPTATAVNDPWPCLSAAEVPACPLAVRGQEILREAVFGNAWGCSHLAMFTEPPSRGSSAR